MRAALIQFERDGSVMQSSITCVNVSRQPSPTQNKLGRKQSCVPIPVVLFIHFHFLFGLIKGLKLSRWYLSADTGESPMSTLVESSTTL